MTKARDVMTADATWIETGMTVIDAAKRMAQDDYGALPVCNGEGRLQGMITDRDIVVKVLAAGKDPATTTVAEVADQPEVVTIGADDSVEEALRTMKEHAVRRLPVIDGESLVGMVAQADIARSLGDKKTGDLVDSISSAPPNN
jgi:CBS domain-containing protein